MNQDHMNQLPLKFIVLPFPDSNKPTNDEKVPSSSSTEHNLITLMLVVPMIWCLWQTISFM